MLPDLLAGFDLRGALVSLDAASCHPTTAEAITGRGADYLIALKGNRRGLHAAVRDWFDARAFTVGGGLWPCSDTWDDRHGRLVRRRVFVTDAAELPGAADLTTAWPGLRRMVAVEAIRSVGNPAPGAPQGVSCQIRYYLTSSAAPERRVAAAVRAHWSIENQLHWVLDTGFGEDLSRVRNRNAAANLAVLRRIALNLVRADASCSGSLKGKRKMADWDDAFMPPPRRSVGSCVSPAPTAAQASAARPAMPGPSTVPSPPSQPPRSKASRRPLKNAPYACELCREAPARGQDRATGELKGQPPRRRPAGGLPSSPEGRARPPPRHRDGG